MSLPDLEARPPTEERLWKASRPSLRRFGGVLASWIRAAWQTRFVVPAVLLVAAFSIFLPRLAEPEKYLFDEILFAYTAGEYVAGNEDSFRWDHQCSATRSSEKCAEVNPNAKRGDRIGKYQWAHPPLGKLIMGGGIILFGNDPFGWRVMSAVVGAVGIVLAYGLGWLVTGQRAVGLLTAGLLLLDTMYFVYSRMGLVDIFLTVLTLGTLLAFAWYLKTPAERAHGPLLVLGAMLGLSIATKWSAAYGAFFIGLVVLWRLVQMWRASRTDDASAGTRAAFWRHVVLVPVALGVFPVVAYLGAHVPFFLAGNGWDDFVALQRAILRFQTNLNDSPRTASPWWTWPLDVRSVWFGTRNLADDRIAITYALGNPFLYWAFLPAVAWTAVRWWRSDSYVALTVLLVGFFGQWLPWALVGRSSYLYHFLPAVPFGCLAVAATLVHLIRTFPDWRRTLAIEYVVLVALAFAFFYPVVSYYPISDHAYELRLWLSSWR
jgi:dolichyl-phosphate-mannose--protein O-mannosyl transferase